MAKLEAELAEKIKPDNEKLLALAETIHNIKMPTLATEQCHETLVNAQGHLHRAIQILKHRGLRWQIPAKKLFNSCKSINFFP